MRRDGRAADELRPVELTVDFTENPLGSVLCAFGRTKVLCTVCEEDSVPRWLKGSGQGWVTAEYSMLPGSTDRRADREVSRGKVSGRTSEIQRLIGRSLRAVVDMSALGERNPVGRLRRFASGRWNANGLHHRCLHGHGAGVPAAAGLGPTFRRSHP